MRDIIDAIGRVSKQIRSAGEDSQTNAKQKNSPPNSVSVNAVLSLPVSITEYYESKSKHKWGGRIKALLEVAAVGTGIWLGIINLRVLREIEKQTPKVRESADAAKNAADTAAAELRPWISADIDVIGDISVDGSILKVPLHMVLTNTGHSTAINVGYTSEFVEFIAAAPGRSDSENRVCGPLKQKREIGLSIFSGQKHEITPDLTVTRSLASSRSAGDATQSGFPGSEVLMPAALITCIDYQFSEESTHHQTIYRSVLGKRFANQTANFSIFRRKDGMGFSFGPQHPSSIPLKITAN